MRNVRNRSPWAGLSAGVALLLLFASGAAAYVVELDDSAMFIVKWQRSPVVVQVRLSSTANLSDGSSPQSSVIAAMRDWNAVLGTLQFSPQPAPVGAYAVGNDLNEIAMDRAVEGETFPEGVLAITVGYSAGNDVVERDIIFNTAYTWNSYRGDLRAAEDIRRVAAHELGHVIGLDHPDEHSQYVVALMNSRVSDLDRLQSDDIDGGQFLYGAPGVQPANDAFANASAIHLSSNIYDFDDQWVTGSNIGASRETGEPTHAGSVSGHSVWWQWTAPYDGRVEAITRGSNFDTALGVYTGSAVGVLSTVASNDDAETPEQNPTPQRARTSKVNFAATAGTTYHLAVDGYAEPGDAGYTGAISLNLHFTRLEHPAITTPPPDQTVEAEQLARLVVWASGRPRPSYQWQRRAAGSSAWADLTNGTTYRWDNFGMPHNTLEFTASLAMEGDQFRCIASNEVGSVTSAAATLHVTRIPVPVFTTQPQGATFYTDVPARLSAEATRADRYQWYRDGVAIAGATDAELVLLNPQPSDAGRYHVVATNGGGATNSTTVTVSVVVLPVVTNLTAARQVVALGETAALRTSATGSGTLSYQWYHDGWPIAGATSSSYSVRVNATADAGAYWVAVKDAAGTRHGPPSFILPGYSRTQIVGWGWTAEEQAPPPQDLSSAVKVVGGDGFGLALLPDGTVRTWGYVPGDFANWSAIVNIAAGRFGAVGLKADGTVVGTQEFADVPAGLKNVAAIACGSGFALALRTDGTVVAWPSMPAPAGLREVVAVAAGWYHALAVKRDGPVVGWSHDSSVQATAPAGLRDVIAVAAGIDHSVALKRDGSVVAWGEGYQSELSTRVPASALGGVVAISAGARHTLALKADGSVVAWGESTDGKISVPAGLGQVLAVAAGSNFSLALRDISAGQRLLMISQPKAQIQGPGGSVLFTARGAGAAGASIGYQWRRNGRAEPGWAEATLALADIQPATTGLYATTVTSAESVTSVPGILGLITEAKVVGGGVELEPRNIRHPNGNTFDQVLLTGVAEAITADPAQVTRTSFIDLDGDIVQVEMSGPGTLTVVLDSASGPALAANYHQPTVQYMKGHAGIVIAGASFQTNVAIFTVGRATAFDPTGGFDFLKPISATNSPARNGSALFQGHGSTPYDGIADLAYIAISSWDGKFGTLRAGNAQFFASRGYTGIYAPEVEFTGPVVLGDVTAFDEALPVLVFGWAPDLSIAGGDLSQANAQRVSVCGISRLKLTAGTDSHGRTLPAQPNRGVLEQDRDDVTARIVVSP